MVRLLACRALPTPISTQLLSFSRRMITWSNGGNAMVVEWTRKSESASPFLARFRVARPFYPRPSSQLKVHRIYFKIFISSSQPALKLEETTVHIQSLNSVPFLDKLSPFALKRDFLLLVTPFSSGIFSSTQSVSQAKERGSCRSQAG